jgi:hypothetical protein
MALNIPTVLVASNMHGTIASMRQIAKVILSQGAIAHEANTLRYELYDGSITLFSCWNYSFVRKAIRP